MDGETFRVVVEDEKQTELERLGSQQLLVALTDADLTRERVLEVAAASEHAARETFRKWADDEESKTAQEAFATVAEQEDAHLRRVTNELDEEWESDDEPGPMHSYLRGRTETVERIAGGMVGRPLVSHQTHNQLIGFFINEADEATADIFRDLKAETNETLEAGLDLLEEVCATEDDWETAQMVAGYTIQLAYDDYADALQGLGFDPRSVC
ncbi:rubrerythrin family protein [Halogeometricum borinquense]|uniref:Rubrerythrin family protein n=1 Tax=Halogeometricum borinquense TaxID=60847 RepID=A0A6C0UFP4_9EURY|nr:rubrerythrin family protein [Halogeometricum borinquense]QIB74205.1 rubrerythrin family protein [Halogeometricum borinquense]QIQ76590.1 rubrerythrin family protein [Halogeometricum borinquense]